ncbi:Condensin-2 complex subunit G2 [Amphibalanus amphitrite]|uniref:Condensin-2 complex subunit G2 n=1 Tax=Amphibalanus amphitrite TaxID=1232801 RepID=A0A6A4W040_AMPAM|nr:Condensin-2 complex subunit G2 [Amphibalanus amphitrite]
MAAQRRQALVDVVSNHDTEGFLKLLANHRSRKDPFNLDEVLAELPRAQLDTLWESLLSWITTGLESLIPENDEDDADPEKAALVSAIVDTALSTVSALQSEAEDTAPVPVGLLQTASIVNTMLLSLDELPSLDGLCDRIARLSELWWSRRLPEADSLAPPVLSYLLQLVVAKDHKTTRPLVQRACSLQPCLSSGGLTGSGSGRLRQLLCGAAQCPQILAWDEGVRFVAGVLGMSALRMPAHTAIKAVLPSVTKVEAMKYGQAYYRAWRMAETADRESLEEHCIQDFMYHAVHASRAPGCRLARLLYQLLHHIHGQRRHRETAEMLVRLYQPILWRALTVPNETVQLNATFILLDVFPLEDPSETRVARDAELARQSRLLADLLQEASHLVRAAAAKGVCRALSQFWDMMPQDCLKQMMKVLLQDMAYDAASVEVRLQAVSVTPLIRSLKNIPGCSPFMYADDTAALCGGADIQTAKRRAQLAAHSLVEWARSSKMVVAGPKTQVMVLSQWARDAVDLSIKVAGVTVKARDTLNLLGVTLDRLLHFGQHCKKLKQRTRPRLAHLRRLTGRDWGLEEKQLRTGISVVLDNPFTHAYMKSALPFLADAFHDVQLSVRVAVCDLLLKVKQIKNIRYFDVVPVKDLLARLAMDEPPVCRRIVQLMVNSFFPSGESDETLLSRCICLIQENREASRRFYHHSEKVLTLEDAVRLMIAIRQALTLHARKLQARQASAGEASRQRHMAAAAGSDKENSMAGGSRPGKRRLHNVDDRSVLSDASQESASSSDDSALEPAAPPPPSSPLDKEEVVVGLVDVTAVLWTCRLTELAQRPDLLETLQQAWGRVLPLLFNQHRDAPAAGSLLYVASLLPHAVMTPLASHCLSALKELPEDASAERCAMLLDPLINWGRCDDVIELCAERLQAAFDGERSFVASQKNQRRSAGGVRFRDPRRGQPRPRLALRWLMHLFSPSLRRHVLTTKYGAPLRELLTWMSSAVPPAAEERLSSERPHSDRDELVNELVRAMIVVSLALAAGGGSDSADPSNALRELLIWGRGVAKAPARWVDSALLRSVSEALSEAAVNVSLTGCVAPELCEAGLQWLLLHLSASDASPERCLTVLFHSADLLEAVACRSEKADELRTLCREEIPPLTGAAIGQLLRLSSAEWPPQPAQLTELSSHLKGVLAGWRLLGADGEGPQRDLAAVLMVAAQRRIASDKLQGSTSAPTPDLSPLVSALLSPLWRDAAGAQLLAGAVEEFVNAGREKTERGEEEMAEEGSNAEEDAEQELSKVVTAGYVLHALTAAAPSAVPHCRAAASDALVAAQRISETQLTGDDAAPQHLSAAKRLLEELNARA